HRPDQQQQHDDPRRTKEGEVDLGSQVEQIELGDTQRNGFDKACRKQVLEGVHSNATRPVKVEVGPLSLSSSMTLMLMLRTEPASALSGPSSNVKSMQLPAGLIPR